jgi:hypothetical protein
MGVEFDLLLTRKWVVCEERGENICTYKCYSEMRKQKLYKEELQN